MNIIAIIPAREGSTRFPGKNYREFNGKPLISWTLEAAIEFGIFDEIIVSTNSKIIKSICQTFPHGEITIHNRSEELSTNDTPMSDVIEAIISKDQLFMLLQPTSPLRTSEHMNAALFQFKTREVKSLISVNRYTYEPNGAIYISDIPTIYKRPISFYLMEAEESIDIDYEYQFKIAEALQR